VVIALKSLKNIIYSKFISSALIPVFFIELALLLLYFGISSYLIDETSRTLLKEVSANTKEIIGKEVDKISQQLGEVSSLGLILQKEHQAFFRNVKAYPVEGEKPVFKFHENGLYYKINDNGGSSFAYSTRTKIDDRAKARAYHSEFLDKSFKSVYESSNLISQLYINTSDNMHRLYPAMTDVPDKFLSNFNVKDFNFYYEADINHNPLKKPVWTSAYLDPAGQGWITSCIVPVYNSDKLEGVIGIDITLSALVSNVLELDIGNDSEAFIVDKRGVVLAMSDNSQEVLSLSELKEHVYSSTIKSTVEKPEDFKIINHPDLNIRSVINRAFLGNENELTLNISGKDYYVFHSIVPENNWHIFVLKDKDKLFKPIYELRDYSRLIGYYAIGVMLVFYMLFFLYLSAKSRKFAKSISEPLENLATQTKEIGKGAGEYNFKYSEIAEIVSLNDNFKEMSVKLNERTNEIISMEIARRESEQRAELLAEQSMIDSLSGLYNETKISLIIDEEKVKLDRYERPFTIAKVCLDNFKYIIDHHGFKVADNVIVGFSKILQSKVGEREYLARLKSGDFIIIYSGKSKPEAEESVFDIKKSVADLKLNGVLLEISFEIEEGSANS